MFTGHHPAGVYAGLVNGLSNCGHHANGNAIAQGNGVFTANPDTPGNHTVLANNRTTGHARTTAYDAVGPNATVMPNMHLIIHLYAVFDHRIVYRAAVYGGASADAYVGAYYDTT